jgi:hypothetical protein
MFGIFGGVEVMKYNDYDSWSEAIEDSQKLGFMILARVDEQCRKVYPDGATLPLAGEEEE